MSNKHWCMPKYFTASIIQKRLHLPFDMPIKDVLDQAVSRLPLNALKNESDEQRWAWSIILEYSLAYRNTPCLFIETRSLLNFLNNCEYSQGVLIEAMQFFQNRFFCFPATSIAGINLRPCVFGLIDNVSMGEALSNAGLGTPQFTKNQKFVVFYIDLPGEKTVISVQYLDNLDAQLSGNQPMRLRDPISRLVCRLCMATVVYAAAFPGNVKDGLPLNVKARHLSGACILTAAPEILEGATRTSVSMHIRAGHFKTLQHERFKRNEDGTPKIIFVRQTVVAGKLTPKTAVGL